MNKKKYYSVLLFDADDTLLDFKAAEKQALYSLFEDMGIPLDEERHARYSSHNTALWKKLEKGEITREDLLDIRFTSFFEKEGIIADGRYARYGYFEHLSEKGILLPDAIEVLDRCREFARVYIASNGVASVQTKRFAVSGIDKHCDGVFISEYIGYQKPTAGFFEHCARVIPGFEKESTLMIGDSLSADILGGNNFGIDTCHISPKDVEYTSVRPTFCVHGLDELMKYIDPERSF